MKKYLAVFLLCSALAGAADFITGQAARAIFGQQTFTAQDLQLLQPAGALHLDLIADGFVEQRATDRGSGGYLTLDRIGLLAGDQLVLPSEVAEMLSAIG